MSVLPRRLGVSALVVFLLASAVSAESPREELLRLLPDDVGFCVVLQDLRGHRERLAASPFVADLLNSPLAAVVRSSPEMQQLLALEKVLKQLGIDWRKLRDEVLGDAIVLAYRPPAPQQPTREMELALLHARDPKVLADLLTRLNETQKQSGELKDLQTREHAGRKYHRRVEARQESFYYLRGPILAVSSREAAMRAVIDAENAAGTGEAPVAKQFRLLGADAAPVAFWLNPRAFDAEMEIKAAAAQGAEAAFLTPFLRCWKALEGVAVTTGWNREFEVAVTLRGRLEGLPESVRGFLPKAGPPSTLWARFPDDALFAAAGRLELPALFDLFGEFATREDRAAFEYELQRTFGAVLDRDVVKELLPYLGPDCGVCVSAPTADGKGWFPHVLLATRVERAPGEKTAGASVLELLNAYVMATALHHNRTNKDLVRLKRLLVGEVEIKYLVSEERFLPGLQPAFAVADGHLLLASSPEAIQAFLRASPRNAEAKNETPLARMSLKALRQYVLDWRTPLTTAAAERNRLSPEETGRRLDNLLMGLALVNRLELTQRAEPGRATWTLRLQTSRPLTRPDK